MDHSAHSQQTSDPEEEDESLDEKKVEEKIQQAYDEQVPEAQMAGYLAQFFGGVSLLHLSNRREVWEAFKAVNNPNFESQLTKYRTGQEYRELKRQYAVAKQEIEKQKKRATKSGKPLEEAKVGAWRWGHKINLSEFERKGQALVLTGVVQNRIEAGAIKEKIKNTTTIFGLDETHATELKKSLAKWLKDNPGGTIDNYLSIYGRKLYLKQSNLDEKKLDQKTRAALKGKDAVLQKQNAESARLITAREEGGLRIRTHEEIRKILHPADPNKKLTREELRQVVLNVLHGPSPTQPTASTTLPTISATQPAPVPTPPPPQSIQQPIISKIPFKFSLPSLNLSKIFHPFSSSSLLGKLDNFLKVNTLNINRQILSKISNFGSTLNIGLSKIGSKILGKLGSGAISKVAAQALGSLIPGIGNVAAAIFSALGLDDLILRFAFQAALFAVLVVVGVFVFIIIGTSSLFSTNTSDNAMIIPLSSSPSGTSYNWQEFEEKYLSMTNRQEVRPLDTWEEFSQLLTLDTDRHNQVQK